MYFWIRDIKIRFFLEKLKPTFGILNEKKIVYPSSKLSGTEILLERLFFSQGQTVKASIRQVHTWSPYSFWGILHEEDFLTWFNSLKFRLRFLDRKYRLRYRLIYNQLFGSYT